MDRLNVLDYKISLIEKELENQVIPPSEIVPEISGDFTRELKILLFGIVS
jgi:hypothetical protein